MAAPEFLDIDPRTLHPPSRRLSGADPVKLLDQTARYGSSVAGLPPGRTAWVGLRALDSAPGR